MPSPETGGVTGVTAPYVGLRPYEREERGLFFGRDQDARFLYDKILAARLTIFYSLSGLGKSSVLRALVVPRLEEGGARVVRFEEWAQENPTEALKHRLREVAATVGAADPGFGGHTLLDLVGLIDRAEGRPVVLVLDQFEEFLTNHQDQLDPLRKELASLVRSTRVDAQVVLSLREEFLGALEPFRHEILDLFQSTYRLEALDDGRIGDAIRLPAERFGGSCDPELVVALTQDLKPTGLQHKGTVDLPMLQIVCTELWEKAERAGSRTLTLDLYREMGGAQTVLEDWVEAAMPKVWDDQLLTARMMLLLAPQSGLKVSFSAADLAKGLDLDMRRVERELQRLADVRILSARNYSRGLVYELQHDALIKVVAPWRDEVRRQADRIQHRAATQKRLREIAIVLAIVAAAIVGFVQWDSNRRLRLRSAVSTISSEAQLKVQSEPTMGLLLGVAAHLLAESDDLFSPTGTVLRTALANAGGIRFRSESDSRLVRLSADASTLLTAAENTALVWHAAEPYEPPLTLVHPDVPPESPSMLSVLAVSDNGRLAATADNRNRVFIWNLVGSPGATMTPTKRLTFGGLVSALAFSPGGEQLAIGIDRIGVEVRSLDALDSPTQLPLTQIVDLQVLALTFKPATGSLLAGTVTDYSVGHVLQWDDVASPAVARPEPLWEGTGQDFSAMAFGGGGRWFASADSSGNVRVWDLESPDRRSVELTGLSVQVEAFALSSEGAKLALAATDERTVTVWDLQSRVLQVILRGHGAPVVALSLGRVTRLASVATDGARVWDLDDPTADPRVLATNLDRRSSADLAFWPNRPWALVNDTDGALYKIDMETRPGAREQLPGAADTVPGAQAVSSHGRWLAAGSGNRLLLWDRPFETPGSPRTLHTFGAQVDAATFSPDERWLVAGASDGSVVLWNLDSGTAYPRTHGAGVTRMAFDRDSRWLATSGQDIFRWNLQAADPGQVTRLPALTDRPLRVMAMAFDPSNRGIAAVGDDGTISLWDTDEESVRPPRTVDTGEQKMGAIVTAAFSSDGRSLALGNSSGAWLVSEVWSGPSVSRIGESAKAVQFSADGTRLAVGTFEPAIEIWRLDHPAWIGSLTLSRPEVISTLSFSHDGRWLGAVIDTQGRTQARAWAVGSVDLVPLACRTAGLRSLPAESCNDSRFDDLRSRYENCAVCAGVVPER